MDEKGLAYKRQVNYYETEKKSRGQGEDNHRHEIIFGKCLHNYGNYVD